MHNKVTSSYQIRLTAIPSVRVNKFVTNSDGSVDWYLHADSPGKAKEANWLPAPKAQFTPMMRLYWQKDTPPSIIDGTWKPPAITVARLFS